MDLLIDTHVFVWLAVGDRRAGGRIRDAVVDPDNRLYLSVVSRWEIALKEQRSPAFALRKPFEDVIADSPFLPLGLDFDVPARLAELPSIHSDPFDRILIAQALHHGLTLVTGDRVVRRYPVPSLW